ncbi:MAG: BON domain-containing protein [Pseudomonadota bacterium]|nr:BON domain-containing protein [Pseudomonadota bacterium]
MRLVTTVLALAVTAALTTACDRPKTQSTAYNNSGASATPSTTTTTTPSTSLATTNMAPGPAGDASGAVSETMTTGKVKAAIAADPGMRDSDVSVTTNAGVVMLSGTVKSQDQVSIATNLAQKMDGVSKVESSITVK